MFRFVAISVLLLLSFPTLAGTSSTLTIFEGNNQFAAVNEAVAIPPAVRIADQSGNPLAGVEVTFQIIEGGGLLTGATAFSDADGIARVGSWVLGTPPGTKRLQATLAANPALFVVFNAEAQGKQATVTLSDLDRVFDGSPKPVTVTTEPADLFVRVTYDGETSAPSSAGSYIVDAIITDSEYVGEASGVLVIEKGSQSITFAPIANRTADQALSFFPTLSTSSDLPASLEIVSGPASAAGELIELTGAVGTVEVRATQPGTSNWLPADPVTRIFDITPGAAASIDVFSGNNQSARIGTSVDFPLAAIVHDVRGNPVPAIDVVFTVIDGPGQLQEPNASTDANGIAQSAGLNVGTQPGSTVIEATVSGRGLAAARFTALSEAIVDLLTFIDSGIDLVERGQWVTYYADFSNDGPDPAPGVLVSTSLSEALDSTTIRWQCESSAGTVCPAASGTSELNLRIDLPASEWLTFILEARVAETAPLGDPIISVASATTPEGVIAIDPARLFDQNVIDQVLPAGEMIFSDSFEQDALASPLANGVQ